MSKIIVKSESPQKRCEICHQTDCFDPHTDYCSRCSKIILPNSESTELINKHEKNPLLSKLDVELNKFAKNERKREEILIKKFQWLRVFNFLHPGILIAGLVLVFCLSILSGNLISIFIIPLVIGVVAFSQRIKNVTLKRVNSTKLEEVANYFQVSEKIDDTAQIIPSRNLNDGKHQLSSKNIEPHHNKPDAGHHG